MSTGPSPAPSSARPCRPRRLRPRARRARPRRAAARARAALRASPSGCSRRRASPRRRWRSTGISKWRAPSKRWSTASSPWPPVTIAARAPRRRSRSASSRRDPPPGERLAPPSGSASRPSRAETAAPRARSTASSSSSCAPELATITGSTTSGTRCVREEVRDRLDHRAREEHPGLRGVDADVARKPRRAARARTRRAARERP